MMRVSLHVRPVDDTPQNTHVPALGALCALRRRLSIYGSGFSVDRYSGTNVVLIGSYPCNIINHLTSDTVVSAVCCKPHAPRTQPCAHACAIADMHATAVCYCHSARGPNLTHYVPILRPGGHHGARPRFCGQRLHARPPCTSSCAAASCVTLPPHPVLHCRSPVRRCRSRS